MKNFFKRFSIILFFSVAFSCFSKEINIKGNFAQWAMKPELIDGWGLTAGSLRKNPAELKLLPRDENGFSTLHLKNHPKGNSFLLGHTRFPVAAGDEMTVSGTIRGKGKLSLYYCRYDVNKRNCGYSKAVSVPLSPEEKIFEIKIKVEDTAKCKIRFANLAFSLQGSSSEIYLKNLKLSVKSISSGSTAKEDPSFRFYPVGKLVATPGMDIEKDLQKIWKDVPAGEGFYLLRNTQFESAARQTSIKMGHDTKYFYLLACCNEPEMEKLVTDPKNYFDGLKSDDQIEMGITHDRKVFQNYFVANTGGGVFQLRSTLEAKSAGLKKKDHFYICLAIPMDGLLPGQKKVEYGIPYYFNVGRSRYAGGGAVLSSYAKGFGSREKFAVLRFFDSKVPREQEKDINEIYYARIRSDIDKIKQATVDSIKKHYTEYGTLDETNTQTLVKLAGQAKKADSIEEMLKIVRQWQQWDEKLKKAVKKVRFELKNPENIKAFYVNAAKFVPDKNGIVECELIEGVNCIAFESKNGGKLDIRLKGHPETDGRWRINKEKLSSGNWKSSDYNDAEWSVAQCDPDGSFSAGNYGRQLIVWNRTFHGPHRILPLAHCWNISEDSVDSLQFANYSPLAFDLKDYTVEFYMPEALKVGEIPSYKTLSKAEKVNYSNIVPERITVKTDPERKNYRKYILEFSKNTATAKRTTYTLLPLELSGMKSGNSFNVFYSRKANGNFTELMQKIPFNVLPPVNGRRTKQVKFIDEAWNLPNMSSDFYEKLFRQHIKSGLNMWKWGSGGSMVSLNEQRLKNVEMTYLAGAEVPASTSLYPIWGCDNLKNGALYKYIVSTTGAKARFFNDEGKWEKLSPAKVKKWKNVHKFNRMYCPTFMLTEGRHDFVKAVKKDFKDYWLNTNPYTCGFYLNWENHVWDEKIQDDYCFCERCKKAFRKYAGLSGKVDLSDNNIKKNFKNEWYKFRSNLDGQLLALVSIAARQLGKHCYIYTQIGQTDYWKGAYEGIDTPSPALPGNAAPDSKNQHFLDSSMAEMRENTGVEIIIGQHMVPTWGRPGGKNGYLKYSIASQDGYLDPASFKARAVRMVASLHGGFSLWGTYALNNGTHYYIGEASRLISDYEPLFVYGERNDSLVRSKDTAYPNILVLTRKGVPLKNPETGKYVVQKGKVIFGEERLVLLFNESGKPEKVEIENLALPEKSWGKVWEKGQWRKYPAKMTLTIPANDVLAVYLIGFPAK